MGKGYSWKDNCVEEIDIMGRIIECTYESEGYFAPGRYIGRNDDCYPDEGDCDVYNIRITWYSPETEKYCFEVVQGDRNWKRLEKFCLKFIDKIYGKLFEIEQEKDRPEEEEY